MPKKINKTKRRRKSLKSNISDKKYKELIQKKKTKSISKNQNKILESELNTKYGSGFSIQPKFSQSAYFRFHNKSEICKGLYFVGAGTHPGAGVPGVLSSAKVLDKII